MAEPYAIKMPKLSDTMTEGTLAKWTIKEGDAVKVGQSIADVETDKATMEMTSFFEGTIHKLVVKAGDKIPDVGHIVGHVECPHPRTVRQHFRRPSVVNTVRALCESCCSGGF